MPSFAAQIESTRRVHEAATSLEIAARARIDELFNAWDSGEISGVAVRWELERVIRNAYRGSAALASAHMQKAADLPNWKPTEVFNNSYLQSLLADARRNLRDYKKSDRGEVARRRAVFRIEHGAGVAAQRGFSDGQIAAAEELEDFGVRIEKMWRANFVDNTPCEYCTALHGKRAPITGAFSETNNKLKVYGTLTGPPRHPRCRCYLVMLIVTLENAFEKIDTEVPQYTPQTLSTRDVRRMPVSLFVSIVKLLQKAVQVVGGLFRG